MQFIVCIIPHPITPLAFYSSFTNSLTTIIGNLGFCATCEMLITGSTDVRITISTRLADNCVVWELRNTDEVVNTLSLKELAA